MRSRFPGYYRRTDEELSRIWEDGIFVLDANVLLNLYRYSEGTREELLGVLWGIKDRLWIPHQVADEFHRNRQVVISDRRNAYSAVRKSLSDARKDAENKMGQMHTDPGIIEAKDLRNKVDESFRTLIAEAEKLEKGAAIQSIQETDSPEDDEIWQAVGEIYEGRIGEGLLPHRALEVLEVGPRRYESRVPPGFKDQGDQSKPGDRQFGDLILWFETIDEARTMGRPVLFVTDDRKEDWWSRIGTNLYPHPDLGNEMHREAGVLFHMFVPLDFVRWAGSRLNQEISVNTAEEIQELLSLEDLYDSTDQRLVNYLRHLLVGEDLATEDDLMVRENLERLSDSERDRLLPRLRLLAQLANEDVNELNRAIRRMARLGEAEETK